MGTVYGVNVWNGAGIRASSSVYGDSGWYTPAGSGGFAAHDVAVDVLSLLEQIVNSAAPFTVDELTMLTVEMVSLVTVDDLITPAPLTFAIPDEAQSMGTADLAVTADPPVTRPETLVEGAMAGFEVPDWITVEGKPVAVNGLVLAVWPTVAVVAPGEEIQTYPAPADLSVAATGRWLPRSANFSPSYDTWYTYSEYQTGPATGYTVDELAGFLVEDVALYKVSDLLPGGTVVVAGRSGLRWQAHVGSRPVLRPKYEYWRGGAMIRNGGVSLAHGQYYYSDDINWSSPQVTFMVVAVLRTPDQEWYGVLETCSTDEASLADPLGVRYSRTGVVSLWADQVLASIDLSTGFARPAQPVVIGLNVDMDRGRATLMTLDTELRRAQVTLPYRVNPGSRLMLGRSPLGARSSATMEVLEVGFFDTKMGANDMPKMMAVYDRMYGVSAS